MYYSNSAAIPDLDDPWPNRRALEAELYLKLSRFGIPLTSTWDQLRIEQLKEACERRNLVVSVEREGANTQKKTYLYVCHPKFKKIKLCLHKDPVTQQKYLYIYDLATWESNNGALKQIFPLLMEIARDAGCCSIQLSASFYGKYAWLRYGFRPDAVSWSRVANTILKQAPELLSDHPNVLRTVQRICSDPDPSAILEMADLSKPTVTVADPYVEKKKMRLPLGKALLMSADTTAWGGILDLSNLRLCGEVLAYCGAGQKRQHGRRALCAVQKRKLFSKSRVRSY